jgi:PAS domain S-box-containing protein
MAAFPYPDALADLFYTQGPDLVGLYDLALGWFTQVNPAGVRLLGYASETEFLADPDHSLRSPPWTGAQWQALCDRAQHEGRVQVQANIRHQTGEALRGYLELAYFEAENRPLLLVRLSAQGRLQQAERELAHSVRRFEAVFTNATIGIIVCDRPGGIVSANQLASQLFGYEPEALLGQPIEALVPDAAGRYHEQLRASFNAHPQVRSMGGHRALLGQRHDGTVFPVEVSLSYFHLDEELYVVAYILDISLKKAAEQELLAQHQHVARLNADLEQQVADRTHALLVTLQQLEKRTAELTQALAAEQELGELKSRFVSMASHEFRTPLTAVLTSADLIGSYPSSAQQPERLKHVQRIRASAQKLNDILEEFLSVGRIEEGRLEVRPTRLDLASLLPEALADVQSLVKPGQTIAWQLDCPNPVQLDASLLRKIMVNLLSNALKYSGAGSTVTVRAACRDQLLTLSVADQGIGISAEDQTHLFERFFRARNVTTIPGTGLGLYIIARYLELMGGTVALQSALGKGTTVTITVPYENDITD